MVALSRASLPTRPANAATISGRRAMILHAGGVGLAIDQHLAIGAHDGEASAGGLSERRARPPA